MPTYIPPQEVADVAKEALQVRQSKPPSQRGGTTIGIARANQLANRRPISIETIYRMVSYFDRHEVDKQGSTWDEYGKGKQAWNLWGGDVGRTWANRIVKEYEMQDKKSLVVVESEHEGNPIWCVDYDDPESIEPLACFMSQEEANAFKYGMDYAMESMGESEDMVEVEVETKVDMTMAERDALPDEDFAIPSSRNFPVATPQDVADAVSSWGRYRGDVSFETFKENLIRIAKRKGRDFYAMLPELWRNELEAQEMVAKSFARKILGA